MEILCACDEHFLPHTATMLCSLLEHNPGAVIHILHHSAVNNELPKLKSFVVKYGCEIFSYEMQPTVFANLQVDKWASTANYYRLLAPQILPKRVQKILYLDSDLIVRQSLHELWDIDVTNHALAAVVDYGWEVASGGFIELPPDAKYFNSGVMIINLDYWRQQDVSKRAVRFILDNPSRVYYWDQDALNALLVDQWISLPHRWNATHEKHFWPCPAIVHFCGPAKPWHWYLNHPFKFEYHRYRRKTPWRRYKLEGSPCLGRRVLRHSARVVLSDGQRRWLRALIPPRLRRA